MSDEDLRAIAQEEINKAITENLDSAIIFKYISNLENKIEKQQKEIEKYKILYAQSTADRVLTSLKDSAKSKEDLEMLYKGCQIEIEKQNKIIDLMAEQLRTPVNSKEWVIEHYTKKVETEEK